MYKICGPLDAGRDRHLPGYAMFPVSRPIEYIIINFIRMQVFRTKHRIYKMIDKHAAFDTI